MISDWLFLLSVMLHSSKFSEVESAPSSKSRGHTFFVFFACEMLQKPDFSPLSTLSHQYLLFLFFIVDGAMSFIIRKCLLIICL